MVFRYTKKGFSPYSSPVMLISQKIMQDKRVETDFRHLNIRIVKNNLAYPLVRDTFSFLGNSKCEVLLVLRSKRCISCIMAFRGFKKVLQNITIFWECLIFISKNAHGLNISPSIWQLYINAILGCLQSRKHCKAIMDDLLLFTPTKRAHMAKLEDLLQHYLRTDLKYLQKVSII